MGSDEDDDNRNASHRPSPRVSHKITLAAISSLFAVTLLVILLFLYAKYRQNRRRQRRRIDFVSRLITAHTATGAGDHVDHASPKTALGGLDPAVVSSLPEFIYKHRSAPPSEAVMECSVCLGAVAEGAKVRLLPNCCHTFHVECVDLWLASHTTCPLCRAEVEPRQPKASADALQTEATTELPQPTAPPVEEISLLDGETASVQPAESKPSGSGSASAGSRLGSFRRMLTRERSSIRSLDGCVDQVSSVGVSHHHDLERQ